MESGHVSGFMKFDQTETSEDIKSKDANEDPSTTVLGNKVQLAAVQQQYSEWVKWQPTPSRCQNMQTTNFVNKLSIITDNLITLPSMLWHGWFGNRKAILPVKKQLQLSTNVLNSRT